jgi:hypothetical protein
MAKIIKYQYLSAEINHGTEGNPNIEQIFIPIEVCCPTESVFNANYPLAEKQAYPGTIDVSGEFDPEPVAEPTADDVLNALLGVK